MQPIPSLRQLRYLVAVAERLNFTQAAEDCFVTQSTLSAGVKELEQILGARLLERDRQRVLVTPLGEEIIARARHLLAQAEDLAAHARDAAAPMRGTLRLGAIPTIAPFLLPRLVPEVRGDYPELRLVLREDTTAQLLLRLAAGRLDFALLALPYELGDLVAEPLFDDELVLVAPSGDLRAANARYSLDRLDPERLLLLEEGHCLREHTLVACGVGGGGGGRPLAADHGGIEASSLVTLVQMVAGGLGVALLPAMALDSGLLTAGGLVHRRLQPAPSRRIALVARPSSTRVKEFRMLGDKLRKMRPHPADRR
jgi:LysR family transcriptional regulator, hydrogen peroxide-inducible genes activator